MVEKPEEAAAVIKKREMKYFLVISFVITSFISVAQQTKDSVKVYKKRVLETTEVDFLTSYYTQDGDNAAVSGGIGTEKLTDVTGAIVVSIPLNDDDVLTIDAGVSSYTSASSSNINPFDDGRADPFQASSGSSSSDLWKNLTGNFSHSSDDRNDIWSVKGSGSTEHDYSSIGVGGSYTKLFNEKNTELSVHANVYFDSWKLIYPFELRPFAVGGNGLNDELFESNTITGNANYNPDFKELSSKGRNSYSLGFGFSQILSKNLQGSLALDFVQQQGLLSTPFHRVYFNDIADSFIDDFQLADDIEHLPDSRFKIAIGGRLNWYINEFLTVRTFYRYYFDDWGVNSNTASIEVPIKITDKFTLYPSYRFYNQTAVDYFNPYEGALSTNKFYTSDYDLSKYSSNQFGFGVSYTDIFTTTHFWKLGLKSIDLKFYQYDRNTSFSSSIITAGFKFVLE
jgi:hypothetical protein